MRLRLGLLVLLAQTLIAAPTATVHVTVTAFGGTTTNINTNSPLATLIVVYEACGGAISPPAPLDSQGNTWTVTTGGDLSDGGSNRANMWYVLNPSTSINHNFTANQANCALEVSAYTGASAGPDGAHQGAKMTVTPQALTAITPTAANDLFVAAGMEPTASADATFAPCNNEAGTTNCDNTHFTYVELERHIVGSTFLFVQDWGTTTSLNALTTVWKVNNSFNALIMHQAFLADVANPAGSNLFGPTKLVGPSSIK